MFGDGPENVAGAARRVAQLEAITLAGSDLERLQKTLELKPLRALLKMPPPLPAPVRLGTPAAPMEAATRAERLAEVRAFALARFESEKVEQLVVFEQTLTAPLDAEALAFLRTAVPELEGSMLEEFAKAKARQVQPTEFGRHVRVLTAKEQTALFERRDAGPDGWARYRLQFPKASGIIHLSEVALSRDGTQAVIAIDSQAHWLAGSGQTWFLRRTPKGWAKLCVLERWVS